MGELKTSLKVSNQQIEHSSGKGQELWWIYGVESPNAKFLCLCNESILFRCCLTRRPNHVKQRFKQMAEQLIDSFRHVISELACHWPILDGFNWSIIRFLPCSLTLCSAGWINITDINNFLKEITWKRHESNPGQLGEKRIRYPLCYAAPFVHSLYYLAKWASYIS